MKPQKRIRGGKVRWVGRYVGTDGQERSKTFELEKHAKAWSVEREREVRRGEWIDPKDQETTIGQLWAIWESSARTDGTRKVRELVGRNLGRLERTPIGKVTPPDIRAWTHALQTGRPWVKGCDGLAQNTVDSFYGQLAGCMNQAVTDGLILKSPCKGVKKREQIVHAVAPVEVLTVDEIWRLEAAAREGKQGKGWVLKQPSLARMIIVGAATGLRAGEIAGVRIRSVDFLRKEMTISEQSKTATSEFEWAPLKTKGSRRVIPLPQFAIDALAEELAENPSDDRSMPVFRTRNGNMWSSSTLGSSFKALRKRCGLDDAVTWHGLRHFYASSLIYSGASVKTVQERLGHSSAQTTLEIYAHLWPGEDERTRSAIDAALDRDRAGTGDRDDETGHRSG
ncbi:tyrosine-type recombinase/integrase [Rhodococcus sp. ARP2]|uniref:tyrosine-type recombinase/integrase n=1 Tax=Rhodococcus sp. ARP2 TaxID=1661385 RepID=UPI00064BA5E2|nr:site-specific integrase [Rhodococcus sp. ARP2]